MIDFIQFKNQIIECIKSEYLVKEVDFNFEKEFYYPKYPHILKFNLEQYKVEQLGNMAILSGSGLGIMKMVTVVITPNKKREIPFVIVDFIKMGSKITTFVEFYSSHMVEKDNLKIFEDKLDLINYKYSNIENYIEIPKWYTSIRNQYSPLKLGNKNNENQLCEMVLECIKEYVYYTSTYRNEINDKNERLENFINDLIYKGNPSTTILEKVLGKEEMIRLFKEIVFYYN